MNDGHSHGTTDATTAPNPAPGGARWTERCRGWWRRRSKWFRRCAIALVVILVLQPIVGFFGVPLLIRKVIVPQVEKRLNGTVRLADAQFNPYTWRLGLDRLIVSDADGHETLGFERAEIDFNPLSSLFLPGWRFNDIVLTAPFVDAINLRESGLNLAAVFSGRDATPAPDSDAEPFHAPRLLIGAFEMRDGRGALDERAFAEPIAMRVGGLTFRIENIDTTPPLGGDDVHDRMFVATTDDGARIEWRGVLSLDPPLSKGTLLIQNLSLPHVAAYATRFTDAKVKAGQLEALVSYYFAPIGRTFPAKDKNTPPPPAEPPIVRATVAYASVRGFATEREGTSFVEQPSAELTHADLDALTRTVVIERLALDGGSLVVDRDERGTVNLARMIRQRPAPAGVTQQSALPRARVDVTKLKDPTQQLVTSISYLLEDFTGEWSVDVGEVRVANQSIDVADRSTDEPVKMTMRELQLTAGPFRTAEGFVIPLETTLLLNGSTSRASGTFGVGTRTVELDLGTKQLALAAFAPYLRLIPHEPFAAANVESGTLSADGRFRIATPDPAAVALDWKGSLAIAGLHTLHRRTTRAIIDADALAIDGEARFVLGAQEGLQASWNGTLRGSDGAGGPSLLSVMGLGDGDVRLGNADIDGRVTLHLAPQRDGVGTWSGSIKFANLAAKDIAAGGALAARLGDFALGASAEFTLPRTGGANATWKGGIGLHGADVELRGDAPARASLAAFGVKGEGSVGVTSEGALAAGWNGDASLAGVVASLAAQEVNIEAKDAALNGVVALERSSTQPGRLHWQGNAKLGASTLRRGAGEEAMLASHESATFDGTLEATAAADGGGALALDATLALTEPKASGGGTDSKSAQAKELSLKGVAHAEKSKDGMRATWEATVLARDGAASAGPKDDQPSVTAGVLTINGNGAIDVRGAANQATWRGTASIDDATASSPRAFGGTQIALGTMQLEGGLNASDDAGAWSTSWTGTQELKRVTLDAKDVGVGPAHAELASLGGRSELLATLRDGALDGRWNGDAKIGETDASIGRSSDATRVRATSLTVGGDAHIERPAVGLPSLDWKGIASGEKVAVSTGGGEALLLAGGDRFRFEGDAALAPRDGTQKVVARGDVEIEAAHAARGDPATAKGTVRSIALRGMTFDEAESLVSADRLAIAGASIESELAAPAKHDESKKDAKPPAPPTAADLASMLPVKLRLGEFHLEDAAIQVRGSADGAGGTELGTVLLDQIVLDAEHLATDGTELGTVNMTGRLAGSGKVALAGTIDPFRRPIVADLKLTIDEAPIPPTNPVASRFVGWQIAAGRLNTEIPTTVQDGKVKGTLKFMLDGVELGAKSKSPDAPDLPLDFALAIMKDSKGQVKGTIPFSGDATSPDFSISGLIVDVILNFIGKIATAPFQLIASALEGAGDEDLSVLAFKPGGAELDSAALKRVDLLTKAMNDRPGLSVRALGQFAAKDDERALRVAALRAEIAEKARKAFPPKKNVDDALYRKYVVDLWKETPEGIADRKGKEGKALPPFESIEDVLLAKVSFDAPTALRELARKRADSVVAAFVGAGIAADRVTAALAPDDKLDQKEPQVSIELGMAAVR
ncbi:MAG: DUF748 domain-containing protein [Phycisphaerales bacterium]